MIRKQKCDMLDRDMENQNSDALDRDVIPDTKHEKR